MLMKKKKVEKEYYIATMYKGNGIFVDLKVAMSEKDIFFVRNKDGVGAWHCGSLPKTDYRIIEIKPYQQNG